MLPQTPRDLAFYQPAEWQPHRACWLAWPSHSDLWRENLTSAREEFTQLCKAIGASERLEVLVPNAEQKKLAENALKGLPVRFHEILCGDIWLRDTAPIFLWDAKHELGAVRFAFNGWGGKYVLEGDAQVSTQISAASSGQKFSFPWVLEGGAIEVDGDGTALTTKQCLLNSNRNPHLDRAALEAGLCDALGLKKILWLNDGLLNDHTDGHIDTLARFCKVGSVLCMSPADESDPNAAVLREIIRDLESFTDAKGRQLEVVKIPSPGRVTDADGKILPASYLNFYIASRSVVVPTYGSPHDNQAVKAIARCFPGRKTIGISAKAILSGAAPSIASPNKNHFVVKVRHE